MSKVLTRLNVQYVDVTAWAGHPLGSWPPIEYPPFSFYPTCGDSTSWFFGFYVWGATPNIVRCDLHRQRGRRIEPVTVQSLGIVIPSILQSTSLEVSTLLTWIRMPLGPTTALSLMPVSTRSVGLLLDGVELLHGR